MTTAASFRPTRVPAAICTIATALAIAVLAGCVPPPAPAPLPPPPAPPKKTVAAGHPLTKEEPGFLRLSDMPGGRTPVRVGVLLPFSNGQSATRALAKGMMNSAELALFDAHDPDIVLIAGDEGSTPQEAASAARQLVAEGAEVIIGPVFAASVSAVAPIARDRGIPLIAFSTDRAVAGDGAYLLSYQPGNEVRRVVSYAVSQGHTNFAALIPRTAYGERVEEAFRKEAVADKVHIAAIEHFDASGSSEASAAHAVAASGADAILIGQGGSSLSTIAGDLGDSHAKLLGTGLWADRSLARDDRLIGGWFAAPSPQSDAAFQAKYKAVYSSAPPQLAPLAYDAVSLVAALDSGPAYHRFTPEALTDPNGFFGVSGVFRFNPDGTVDRELAVLSVEQDDFRVVDPAPRTFQPPRA